MAAISPFLQILALLDLGMNDSTDGLAEVAWYAGFA
jgi:hypothetical protein